MMHIVLHKCSQDVLISQILNLAETRNALFCFILVSERLHRDTMELHITVPEAKLRVWAQEAFDSGLGGRAIMKRLQTALDERIFDDPYRDMYII